MLEKIRNIEYEIENQNQAENITGKNHHIIPINPSQNKDHLQINATYLFTKTLIDTYLKSLYTIGPILSNI